LLKNIALDQKAIWTSPRNVRSGDVNWIVPLGAIATASLMGDTGFSKAVTGSPSRVSTSATFSNYGLGALGGAVGGFYLVGRMTHDDHKRETGLLSGESAVNAVAVTTVLQYAFGRQRPTDGNGGGGFWHYGTSFPSNHSAAVWAMASVIAHEYPGPLTKLLAYGLASAVSASRVTGKTHFPTDVLVGGAIGWFVGRHVYLAHHDPEVGGGEWGSPDERTTKSADVPARSAASTFVPLDSWVYPAFERLAAMGYVTSALQGMKPWTRIECAKLTEEVNDALLDSSSRDVIPDGQAVQILETLKREFAQEIAVLNGSRNLSFAVASVYSRTTSISGAILTDGYHLGGQTISYDFGRPFRRGTNAIAGTTLRASEGPLAVFARIEYQHSPSAPPLPDSAVQFIIQNTQAAHSGTPSGALPQGASSLAPVDRADLLEGYISFSHAGWQVSAGKQAMSWGIGEGGSMLLSDNAEPLNMIRLTRTVPAELPGFFRHLGHFRTELFLAKVNGGPYVPHPLLFGQKFSFKVMPNLEVGYGRTIILGRGPHAIIGDPFTSLNFFQSYLGITTSRLNSVPGSNQDSLDLNFDVPGLRHSVTLYADLYEKVIAVYLADPPLGAYRAGMYIPRLPRLSRMDFRFESTSTESPVFSDTFGGLLNYANGGNDGYTNHGELMGNTVGRQGRIFQAWTTYHVSPVHEIQFSFRDHQVDPHFVPGGGLWQDYMVSHEIHARSGFYAKTMLQFEHISHFPVLFRGSVNNVTASVELGFTPLWTKP
jgi:membrane-associated phospholipid phosphatase